MPSKENRLKKRRSRLQSYGVAVLAVAIALLIKLLLDPLMTEETPFLLFFAAVMISALSGGIEAGVLATVLAALISDYLFLTPTYSFFGHNLGQNLRLIVFVLEGLLISWIVAAVNTTKRRLQLGQAALSESKKRYRLLVEAVQDYAIFLLDPQGCVTSWNLGAKRIKGYRASEIIGQHFSRFYPEEDIQRGKPEQELQLAATIGRVEDEGWRVRQDGSRFWANVVMTAITDEAGNLKGFSKVTRDMTERKQAEIALQESEEQLRLFVQYAPANVAMFDLSMRYIKVSQRWIDAYHLDSVEAVLGRSHYDILPEIPDRWREVHQRCLADATEKCQEEQFVRADGSVQWIQWEVRPWHDSTGQVGGIVIFSEDITERKQAEKALRESMAILNTVNQATPTLIYVKDRQGRLLMANPATVHVIGQPEADIIGKTEMDFLSRDEAQQIIENDRRVMETGQIEVFEETIALSEQTRTFLSTKSPYWDDQGNIIGLIGVSTDITERKQAELEREHLLACEQQYAIKLRELNQAALALNSALSFEEVLNVITEQAYRIIGTHQSVINIIFEQDWSQTMTIAHLSDKYAQWRDYDAQLDGSGIYTMICQMNRPLRMTQAELEAHPRWRGFGQEARKHPPLRGWLAAPLVGQDGHNMGLIQLSDKYEGEFTEEDETILVQLAQMASVAVENARLYKAEQQARSAAEASREEAQAANRIKDEFLAVLSHELRSPLNPILGWSSLLQNGKLDQAMTKQALTIIERNAKLQAELIEDLLDVSRILRGKLSLSVSPINLASIIRAAIETVRLAAQAKSIHIETILAPEVGLVSGDSTRLQQVVWNLLSNAVKFTSAGGRVEVRLEGVMGERHSQQPITEFAQITVSDTGKGISADFLPYVFDYFRQADSATTRQFGGLGLGLAIVRHLVELHGGTIQAQSKGDGLGATFTVRLPLMLTQSTVNLESQLSEPSLDLSGVQVLVVDDDTDTRDFLAFLLEQAGARVIAVTTAEEALTALTQSQPDVLVSDIGMPETDGYMLMRQIRALPPEQGGQVKAIALTAYAGEYDQQQALQAGFQRHVAKPVEPEVLIRAIAQLRGNLNEIFKGRYG